MTLIHLTKTTGSGTGGPHQQKSRRTLGITFAAIGTATLLADSMNVPLFDNALNCGDFARFAERTP